LRVLSAERWPGDEKQGNAILTGEILLAGQLVRNPMPVWFPPRPGRTGSRPWHGFALGRRFA